MNEHISAEQALSLATSLIREYVPSANCEIQDYGHQIGCGDLDEWGNIQEVKLRRTAWTEEQFRHAGTVLAIKLRTGGSTAG